MVGMFEKTFSVACSGGTDAQIFANDNVDMVKPVRVPLLEVRGRCDFFGIWRGTSNICQSFG